MLSGCSDAFQPIIEEEGGQVKGEQGGGICQYPNNLVHF